ncbi:MAG: hypothetical protein M0C28_39020 [Candidatus Moduliflexus flocculans]|nr:hypothetical protein [Candidatus Moduliflexus flocculans]
MRKRSMPVVLIGSLLALIVAGQAFAQQAAAPQKLVGKALYEKLQREGRRFMGPPGAPGGFAWALDGKGSYAFEEGTYKRTDFATGEKTPLFNDATIIAAVNAMTGRQEVKLPFSRFQYLANGQKIQFQAFNKVYIYDLASSKLDRLRARAVHHRRPRPRLRRHPLARPQVPGLHPELTTSTSRTWKATRRP